MTEAQAIAIAADTLFDAARTHKRAERIHREAARAAMRARAVILAEIGIGVRFTAEEAQTTDDPHASS